MTDRLKGVTVAFSKDVRADDAQRIIEAIEMIKGVLSTTPIIANSDDWINRTMVRDDC